MSTISSKLAALKAEFTAQNPKSKELISTASAVIPSGTTRSVLHYSPFPLCFSGGAGPLLTSADGAEYLDLCSEYFAGMFGHSHPKIKEAVASVLASGFTLGGPNQYEGELASLLVDRFPSVAAIRFCNSGTEANTMAIATALAFTKRRKVLVLENGYHGGTMAFAHPGPLTLPHEWVYGRLNDEAYTRRQIAEHGAEIGCIIAEPLQGAGGLIAASQAYLQFLRDEATRIGAVLVFDEVVTSRLYYGGLQAYHGVIPDMTTVGKHFGGGFSFGAFGGRHEIMDLYDPQSPDFLFHSGTWNNNLFSMCAGVAAAKLLTREALERTNGLGNACRSGMRRSSPRRTIGRWLMYEDLEAWWACIFKGRTRGRCKRRCSSSCCRRESTWVRGGFWRSI
jgi:glutamate-1-semialdehyde 2,1-aminomutase